MRSAGRLMARAAAGVAVLAACAGCAADGGSPGGPELVASTDVWGSVVRSIAGDQASVTSIVSGSAADPHSYEPSASDAAAITDATLLVYNGGGYDPWVQRLLDGRNGPDAVNAYSLLDASALGEPQPADQHVFYDLRTAKAVAERVATRLGDADPARRDEYRSRATRFGQRADEILRTERAIAVARPGATVVATEPVAHYLLRAAGVTDKTPPGFTAAIAQDSDPAPADVAAVLDLISRRQVSALVFNDQTATEVTRRIRSAAEQSGIPVVSVTETLPAGTDYLNWQADTAGALAAALGGTG